MDLQQVIQEKLERLRLISQGIEPEEKEENLLEEIFGQEIELAELVFGTIVS